MAVDPPRTEPWNETRRPTLASKWYNQGQWRDKGGGGDGDNVSMRSVHLQIKSSEERSGYPMPPEKMEKVFLSDSECVLRYLNGIDPTEDLHQPVDSAPTTLSPTLRSVNFLIRAAHAGAQWLDGWMEFFSNSFVAILTMLGMVAVAMLALFLLSLNESRWACHRTRYADLGFVTGNLKARLPRQAAAIRDIDERLRDYVTQEQSCPLPLMLYGYPRSDVDAAMLIFYTSMFQNFPSYWQFASYISQYKNSYQVEEDLVELIRSKTSPCTVNLIVLDDTDGAPSAIREGVMSYLATCQVSGPRHKVILLMATTNSTLCNASVGSRNITGSSGAPFSCVRFLGSPKL